MYKDKDPQVTNTIPMVWVEWSGRYAINPLNVDPPSSWMVAYNAPAMPAIWPQCLNAWAVASGKTIIKENSSNTVIAMINGNA